MEYLAQVPVPTSMYAGLLVTGMDCTGVSVIDRDMPTQEFIGLKIQCLTQ